VQTTGSGRARDEKDSGTVSPRLLAFYLPQFHPNPENNVWWGNGYTEWTNVARAQPLFEGHYQPRLPADLGFYDLRLPETRQAQAALAREHGIHGFCYYHYWFEGRRILQRPFDEVLESGQPDFPFCLCWANHTWTWKRDHNLQGRLAHQGYSEDDDREHIRWLLGAFSDERYIRINGRPLFLVYWAHSIPDPERTFDLWREEASKAGEAEPYICKVDAFGNFDDPRGLGCDAAVEFWPHAVETMIQRVVETDKVYQENQIFEYRQLVLNHLNREMPKEFKRFPCVVPQWDNTARWKSTGVRMLRGSTPELYASWLEGVIRKVTPAFEPEEQLVFINAWNEWGEGAYLEPDVKYGRAYLQATRQAITNTGARLPQAIEAEDEALVPTSAERLYQGLLQRHEDLQRRFMQLMNLEERSPLLQKSEQRYNDLLGEHRRLLNRYSTLERNHKNLQERFARTEVRLVRASTQNQQKPVYDKLIALLQLLDGENAKLTSWLHQLDWETLALLESRRWRIGNASGKVLDKALSRSHSKTPVDRMRQILQDFRSWQKQEESD
jgi:hypothetical protein